MAEKILAIESGNPSWEVYVISNVGLCLAYIIVNIMLAYAKLFIKTWNLL